MKYSASSITILGNKYLRPITILAVIVAQLTINGLVQAQGTWTSQSSPATLSLYMVKAVNQNIAWACGNGGTVVRCIDGSSWTRVDGGSFGPNAVRSICAIDANTALISFSKAVDVDKPRQLADTAWIYRTTNGGSSWQIVFQQIGGWIDDVRMIDSLNGIAFGDPTPGDLTMTFLKTWDGGAHWSRIATGPVASSNTTQSSEVGYQQSMAVTDTNHIWIATYLVPTWTTAWIRRTTDGGKTWDRFTFPQHNAGYLTFSDSLQGLCSWYWVGGDQLGCDRTTDGGQTWITVFRHNGIGASWGSVSSVAGGRLWMTDSSDVYEFSTRDTLLFGIPFAHKTTLSCPTIYWIDMKKEGGSLYGWLVTRTGKIYKYEPLRWQFNKYAGNPILTKSATGFDARHVISPCVLYLNGTYRMWYQGLDGTNSAVGYATSPDGINWTKYAGNPVLQPDPNSTAFDGHWITSPRVHYDGQRFHMFYTGVTSAIVGRIGYAYSSDGIHWTKNSTYVMDKGISGAWDEATVSPGDFRKVGSTWELWYDGKSNAGEWRTGYASANDSVHWSRHPSMAPIIEKGIAGQWDADGPVTDCVKKVGNDYHMWYENNAGTQIGYAVSYDGISWNKSIANPVLSPTQGTWDQAGVMWAWMVRTGNRHFLYYSAIGTDMSIGLAIDSTTVFPDTITDIVNTGIRTHLELPEAFALSQNYPNPFNPSTTIQYQMPRQSLVTLKIFDLLGREVATLVNEQKNAGSYSARWDASRLSSGVYFYTITAGAYRETKRMILMK